MGIYADFARARLGNALIPLGGIGTAELGSLYGEIAGDVPEKEDKVYSGGWNWLPGYGDYNVSRTRLKHAKEYGASRPKRKVLSEHWGQGTSAILPALILGAAGGIGGNLAAGKLGLSKDQATAFGAAVGTGVGAVVPDAIATLMALLTKTRSKEKQREYMEGGNGANWWVPGRAKYNYWKTMGRIHADQNEAEGKDKSRKKDKEDKESQDKEASVNKQAYDWTWENVGNTAKDWGRETLDFVKENPWTSAAIAAVPIAGIVGLSSKRRNKLRNFLLTLTGTLGVGGLVGAGLKAWDYYTKKNPRALSDEYMPPEHSNTAIRQSLGPDPEEGGLMPGEAAGGAEAPANIHNR